MKQENQPQIPNLVDKLYALRTRKTNENGIEVPLTENQQGVISELVQGDFFYNLQRKRDGIAELRRLLEQKKPCS